MAHAQGNAGIKAAIRGGVRSIEHGIFLDEEAIEMMTDHGTWLVPTLTASLGVAEAAKSGVRYGRSGGEGAHHRRGGRSLGRAAIAAGVKIAMGTDATVARTARTCAN